MARLLKCWGTCGEKFEDKDLQYVGKLRYCNSCRDEAIAKVEAKEKAKADKEKQKVQKEADAMARKDLYRAIKMYYRLNCPDYAIPGIFQGQIKNFINTYNFTYKGILLTMKYVFEVERSSTPVLKYGIGFVPRKYDDAKEYYRKQFAQSESLYEQAQYETVKRKVSKGAIEQDVEAPKEIDMNDLL